MADRDNVLIETFAFVAGRRCCLRNVLKGENWTASWQRSRRNQERRRDLTSVITSDSRERTNVEEDVKGDSQGNCGDAPSRYHGIVWRRALLFMLEWKKGRSCRGRRNSRDTQNCNSITVTTLVWISTRKISMAKIDRAIVPAVYPASTSSRAEESARTFGFFHPSVSERCLSLSFFMSSSSLFSLVCPL